ncbi:MAG: 50S ribosomal protein L4 [Clostridia bacterium]|nr:50S ribosomal protein L4 [Clostridia bacterium]MBQ4586342.1 50S ribosomal protein L4 [Clostridia bacterium]MBQ6883693.1 50S ribosomal protein L4 [Clostridia bacterium]MBR2933561.1 50S ribosomal protein L4 [Clostridia bacterium]
MLNTKLYNMKAEELGVIELNEDLFTIEYNQPLIHQAVVTRLANERQGTKSALTRTEVRGGGKKPFRQKGTGNARQGSTRAPQWIKGGVVFAPKSRDFRKKMNICAKRIAMFSALSRKLADNEFYVIDNVAVSEGKTKEMVAFLNSFGFEKTVLVVMCNNDEKVIRAARNLQNVTTLPVEQLNTYDIVRNSVIVLAQGSVEKLQEVYGE